MSTPVDTDISTAVGRGDLDTAVRGVVDAYGAEVGGYLASRSKSADDAADAFSLWLEDVWRGLAAFRFESSLRTWLYVLARNAMHRHLRKERRHVGEALPDQMASRITALAQQMRTSTARYQQTAVKDEVRALREMLTDDEQELLTLRIDRGLEWADVTLILSPGADEATLKKNAATLRKRLERIKGKLKQAAEAKGLI